MKEYTVVNILDMLEAIGEENLSAILSDFSCPINKEILSDGFFYPHLL